MEKTAALRRFKMICWTQSFKRHSRTKDKSTGLNQSFRAWKKTHGLQAGWDSFLSQQWLKEPSADAASLCLIQSQLGILGFTLWTTFMETVVSFSLPQKMKPWLHPKRRWRPLGPPGLQTISVEPGTGLLHAPLLQWLKQREPHPRTE